MEGDGGGDNRCLVMAMVVRVLGVVNIMTVIIIIIKITIIMMV